MYLAWKEIVHNKGRYSLVIVMVFLISYLVYFLTGLAYGLATSYTQAIDRFQADGLVLTEESNDNAMMSFVSDTQFDALSVSGKKAKLGILPGVIKDDSLAKSNICFFGAEDSSFIWPQAISLSDSEVLMDSSLEKKGYAVGSSFSVVGTTKTLTVKGFIDKTTYQTAPVLFVNLSLFREIRFASAVSPLFSAVVYQGKMTSLPEGLKDYTLKSYTSTLPGYSAQVATFSLMIGFLILISSFILGVFTYVLTLQKKSLFAVMKVQGISNKVISYSVISQTFLLTLMGILLGFLLTVVSYLFLKDSLPFAFNPLFFVGISLAFLVFSLVGALFSVRAVFKIDPVKAL